VKYVFNSHGRTYTSLRAKRNSLRTLPKCIPHINIVQFEVARPDSQRPREIIVRLRFLTFGSNDRNLVFGVLGVVRRVPLDRQWSAELWDVDLFCVCAWVDEDELLTDGGVREGGDGC